MSELEEITPLRAIQVLRIKSKQVKLGKNFYLQVTAVIRNLLSDRAAANKKIDKLEAEIVKLKTPPPPRKRVPFEVEGQGEWQ